MNKNKTQAISKTKACDKSNSEIKLQGYTMKVFYIVKGIVFDFERDHIFVNADKAANDKIILISFFTVKY